MYATGRLTAQVESTVQAINQYTLTKNGIRIKKEANCRPDIWSNAFEQQRIDSTKGPVKINVITRVPNQTSQKSRSLKSAEKANHGENADDSWAFK